MGTAAIAEDLTAAQFEEQFGDEKPSYEFWFGKAVQKSMNTPLHGLLQAIFANLLMQRGLIPGTEVRARVQTDVMLVPDVIGCEGPFNPVVLDKPPVVAIEILSPSDSALRLWKKCSLYSKWGVAAVYVVDAEERKVRMWDAAEDTFVNVTEIGVAGHGSFAAEQVWSQLDKLTGNVR